MPEFLTPQDMLNGHFDIKSLGEAANGDENTQVVTRTGETYPSAKKAIKLMTQSGVGFTGFETKALMTASSLANGSYAIVTNDTTTNSGLHLKKSGAWSKVSYDVDERHKTYADESSAAAQASAISTASTDASTKANAALVSSKTYADGVGTSALSQSKTYTDGKKTDAVNESKFYTDNQATATLNAAKLDATNKAESVRVSAIDSAATDATTKANAAQAAAATDATAKSTAAKDAAIVAAATDATAKSNNALTSAKTYTDTAKSSAISTAATDATTKANTAQAAAISAAATDATTKANTAKTGAIADAETYTDTTSITTTYNANLHADFAAALANEPLGAKYRATYPAIATDDGYVLMSASGSAINIGNTFTAVTDKGQLATHEKVRADELGIIKRTNGVKGSAFIKKVPLIETDDGYLVVSIDSNALDIGLPISSNRKSLSANRSAIVGKPCTGLISDIHTYGDSFYYQLSAKALNCKVMGKSSMDWATPHVVDTDTYQVWEADGQSWQTMHYNAQETLSEDASGAVLAELKVSLSPMVTSLRKSNMLGTVTETGDYTASAVSISNGSFAGELYRITPELRYKISDIAALSYSKFCVAMSNPQIPVIVYNVGWPGTSSEKFLPEGVSYTYVDSSNVTQTTTAVMHPSANAYLWTNNLTSRQAVKDTMSTKYPSVNNLMWRFLSWVQGPFDDYNNAMGFLATYRAEQDKLNVGKRHILWDQNGNTVARLVHVAGVQASVDFCQANASGMDWLVGPRYQHKLQDYIHMSAFSTLVYGETTGQAASYIDKYGEWKPLWITNVVFSGSTVTLTTNNPLQAQGGLVVDSDAVPLKPNYGFTLHNMSTNKAIAISSVDIANNIIVITAATALSGSIEVGYAVRSLVGNPDGTMDEPQLASTAGNIKMVGVDSPKIIPERILPKLDSWLCSHKKTYTV